MQKEIIEAFEISNHKNFVDLFCNIYKSKVYLVGSTKEPEFNIWNRDKQIYDILSPTAFGELMINTLINAGEELIQTIVKKIKKTDDDDDEKKYKKQKVMIMKCIKFLGCGSTKIFVEKYCAKFEDKFNEIIFNNQRGYIQYINGQLNLKTGEMEARTNKNFINDCLQYEYKLASKDNKKFVTDNFFKMFNNNEHDYNMMMSWIGYMMTGENNQRKFLVVYGPLASNGKSTTFDVIAKCYPIYQVEFSKEILKKDCSERFRDINLLTPNIRVSKIEEMPEVKIDESFIKKFVNNDGTTLQSRKYYSDTFQTILNNSVLVILTNEFVHYRPEPAVRERGGMFEVKSKFIDGEIDSKSNLCFAKDSNFLKNFNDDAMKNAFTDILLQFTKDYYKTGKIQHGDILKSQFGAFCDVNDTFKEFIDNNFIINEAGRVSRDEFMEVYSLNAGKQKEFKYTLGMLKKYGFTYDKNTTLKGHRGVLFGLEPKNSKTTNKKFDNLETEEENIKAILSNDELCEKIYQAILAKKQKKKPKKQETEIDSDFDLTKLAVKEESEFNKKSKIDEFKELFG
jgi:hypothetical protein